MVCVFVKRMNRRDQETYEITPKSLATIALPQCRVKAVGELEIHVVGIFKKGKMYIYPWEWFKGHWKFNGLSPKKNKNMILVGIYLIHQQF